MGGRRKDGRQDMYNRNEKHQESAGLGNSETFEVSVYINTDTNLGLRRCSKLREKQDG